MESRSHKCDGRIRLWPLRYSTLPRVQRSRSLDSLRVAIVEHIRPELRQLHKIGNVHGTTSDGRYADVLFSNH